MVPCSVLLGTMNMYLVACGTFPQTLILANKTIATALSRPTIERNNSSLPQTTQPPPPNYVTTTTRAPSTPEPILVSTTVGSSTNAPTTSTQHPTYTTTLYPNLRGSSTTQSVKNTEMNNELTTTSIPRPVSLQQNSSANIYTVTKIIKEIQINQDLTPVWVCVGFLIVFGIYTLKTTSIKCEKKKLKRKDSVSPDPEKKNRNSWSTGPTPKQRSFLHAMGSPEPPPIPRRPPPSAPPPPPRTAKMRVEELTQSGALDKIKKVRAAKRQKNTLRNQVMKLRQQQQSINVKSDT